jgi:hypothetical protein
MNPFRRLWTRELGLYATGLALLVQILMAVAHTVPVRAGSLDHSAFCVVDNGETQDPALVAQSCPLCHIPDPLALKPRDPSLTVALVWTPVVYAPVPTRVYAQPDFVNPPARGPPTPV